MPSWRSTLRQKPFNAYSASPDSLSVSSPLSSFFLALASAAFVRHHSAAILAAGLTRVAESVGQKARVIQQHRRSPRLAATAVG